MRVAASNLVAVVGVTLLGWPAGALLIVYWVEAGVGVVRGAAQGLFARREPETVVVPGSMPGEAWSELRGGVSLGRLPPVSPRNVPVVASAVIVLVLFWPIAGVVVLLAVDSAVPVGTVSLAVAGVVVGQAVAAVGFFRERRYVDRSVRAAMGRRHPAAVAVLALGGGLVLATVGSVPSALVVVVAVTKTAVEFAAGATQAGSMLAAVGLRDDGSAVERTGTGRESAGVGSWEAPAESEPSDAAVSGEPTATFRTDRRSLLVRAAAAAALFLLLPPYLFGTLGAVVVGLAGGLGAGVASLGVVLAATVAGRVLVWDVAGGHREYRVSPDRIVAYDRLLDTPQWTVERTVATTVSVEPSRLDRLRPGGPTVVVTTGNDEHRLRALRRPTAFVETLDGEET